MKATVTQTVYQEKPGKVLTADGYSRDVWGWCFPYDGFLPPGSQVSVMQVQGAWHIVHAYGEFSFGEPPK
jgi:hypothetical protein